MKKDNGKYFKISNTSECQYVWLTGTSYFCQYHREGEKIENEKYPTGGGGGVCLKCTQHLNIFDFVLSQINSRFTQTAVQSPPF